MLARAIFALLACAHLTGAFAAAGEIYQQSLREIPTAHLVNFQSLNAGQDVPVSPAFPVEG
jgi:hypothetical protein